jgi:osmotically inducible lipoprotein OsmB
MKIWHGYAIVAATICLGACGTTPTDRALSGAAIGAGSGAAIGAIAGPVGAGTGALIGAGVGATTGVLTNPNQVDLGRPVWER